ncbi:PAS domain-containing sensor histidine kinase [Desertivirga arenae]|uniref:PAS domain-containing sensor histidine kinase n=1 Tax=Desertivirga arenae TaxID=2810309 RepID=UPI001A95E15B|nr:ATP-binding protein [Pedobacter sp. SYSU D00823]
MIEHISFDDPVEIALNSITDVFFVLDAEYKFQYINRSACDFFNTAKTQLMHASFWEVYPFKEAALLSDILIRASLQREKVSQQYYSLSHSRWFNVTAYKWNEGVAVILNLADSEGPVQEEIIQNIKVLSLVLDYIPHIAFMLNEKAEVVYLNKRWTEYTGTAIEEGMGYGWGERIHAADFEKKMLLWDQNVESGKAFKTKFRVLNKKGEYRWHADSLVPLPTKEKKPSLWVGTATDIHDFVLVKRRQQLVEDRLRESLHLATSITTTTPDLIMIYDIPSESIVYLNKSHLSNYSPEELKKMNKEERVELVHLEDRQAALFFHDHFYTATDGEIREIEYRVKKQHLADHDEWMWLNERRMVFQRDEKGSVQQYIAVVQNITDRKEAEIRKTENEVLNKLVEKKEEFISVASHELKTPITTIKASIQILKRLIQNHSDENTLLVFVIKATQQVNKLMSLIGDLLDNTGFKEGKLHLNITTFHFGSLLEEVLHSYSSHRQIQIEGPVDVEIEADEVRLGQVINNLLSNAIKYSPEETSVQVITSVYEGWLKVQVVDKGKGIPPEKLEHLFERFYRVDEKLTDVSGLGLGLYIIAEIIKLHKGKYGVISEVEKGSTFWFEIPLKQN